MEEDGTRSSRRLLDAATARRGGRREPLHWLSETIQATKLCKLGLASLTNTGLGLITRTRLTFHGMTFLFMEKNGEELELHFSNGIKIFPFHKIYNLLISLMWMSFTSRLQRKYNYSAGSR